jgi:1,4-dihydroxy-2-naphthoate octaprenyltransferase
MASISSMFLGTCLAAKSGTIDLMWLALTVIGILALEAAKNASGEVYDYDSGADLAVAEEDRSPYSGGKRVIVDGLMSRTQTIASGAIFYLLGIIIGLLIFSQREPAILVVGIIGVLLAFFYHAPPVKLSYRGFGELAVATVYGPMICCGTFLVQRNEISTEAIFLSIPLGILIAAFLVINEFPDRIADLSAHKMNLVVRLGVKKSTWLFFSLIATAYLGIGLLPLAGLTPNVWLGLIGLPLGLSAVRRLHLTKQTREIIPAQRWTLFSFCLAAFGCGTGLLI